MSTPKPKAAGGSGKTEGRDSWCTPKWLADLIGRVDVDVATNERSHIRALWKCMLSRGDNGLYGKPGELWTVGNRVEVKVDEVVFCNCPYAHGEVIKWVKHWRESRFIFLLRWDPSTEWFEELIGYCGWVWFPKRRINFEPPPDVKASSNPFPHALYMSRPPEGLLDRLAEHGYLFEVDEGLLKPHHGGHEPEPEPVRASGGANVKGGGAAAAAIGGGKGAGGAFGPFKKVKWQVVKGNWPEYQFVDPKLDPEKDRLTRILNEEFEKARREAAAKELDWWQAEYDRQFPGYTGWRKG